MEAIRVERSGGLVTITLARPEKKNALNAEAWVEHAREQGRARRHRRLPGAPRAALQRVLNGADLGIIIQTRQPGGPNTGHVDHHRSP
jgi:enoyl-CoA hydratase/carnithine racemase